MDIDEQDPKDRVFDTDDFYYDVDKELPGFGFMNLGLRIVQREGDGALAVRKHFAETHGQEPEEHDRENSIM